jgi:hypothetical protein
MGARREVENDPWLLALKPADAEKVVAHLVNSFRKLVASATGYVFDLKEVDLTKRLGNRLNNTRAEIGIPGPWDYEVNRDTLAEDDARRLDLRFSTVVDNRHEIELIFECKKMHGDHRAATSLRAYFNEGVRRFVTGSYAPNQPLAFMVGFCEVPADELAESIKRSLAKPNATLGLTAYANGKLWLEPPPHFGAHASFTTCHQRIHPGLTPEITLYHMQLAF